MVFERGVQSIRNDLIRLETLSWKCTFSKKREIFSKNGFWRGVQPTRNDQIHLETLPWKCILFQKKGKIWWEIFSKMVFRRGVQSAWNGVICLKLWVGGADALLSNYAGMLWQQHHWWGGGGVGGWVRKSHNAALGFFSLLSPNFDFFLANNSCPYW